MKKIRDNAAGPPGGNWIWRHPETGFVIRHSNFPGCRKLVLDFLRANNYPITAQFDEEFEENLCANGAPNLCEDFTPPTALEKMGNLARALWEARKTWRAPLVDAEQLQDRRDWCMGNETRPRCNFFHGSTSFLKIACAKCGCSGLKLGLRSSRCPAGKWNSL